MKASITAVFFFAMLSAYGQATDTVKQKVIVRTDTVTKVIYVAGDTPAEFPGGPNAMNKFIKKNFKWKQPHNVVVGKAFVEFWVDTNGKIVDEHVERGLCPTCDKEALRLIRLMPDWKPATHLGKPIKARQLVPIAFTL
ncbi:energy transducer TonB [Chryseolinea lacunae]|uniref:Energy transducer TonB n=1 Tax=Chryseolinea lacunae TaxID=2801331 RepID=A0ABS1KUW8_9BACT|nr:energy transducer TonB [Chryseolinea lacunae]MBL0742492.1 energy transducer TonB [Chryseolinea lacunae]